MFRLLAQAVHTSPEAVLRILTEVLNLKQDVLDLFASLLEADLPSDFIDSANTVAVRPRFLVELEKVHARFIPPADETDQRPTPDSAPESSEPV